MNKQSLALCLSLLSLGTGLTAGTLSTFGEDAGTPVSAIGITGFQTLGSDMVGLEVIASFITSGQQSCIWAATSATAGGCSVPGLFSLVQDGDTFGLSNFWQLQNVSTFDVLTQLVLNGASGTGNTSGTVFDRTFGFTTGTPGSALGRDATGTTSTVADALAIYRNAVSVGAAAAPVGDEFATLDITFGNGLTSGGSAAFVADTDTVGLSGVPEPGTAGVLGIGLLAIGALGRRVVRR